MLENLVSRESSNSDEASTASVSEEFVALLSILEPSDLCDYAIPYYVQCSR